MIPASRKMVARRAIKKAVSRSRKARLAKSRLMAILNPNRKMGARIKISPVAGSSVERQKTTGSKVILAIQRTRQTARIQDKVSFRVSQVLDPRASRG